MSEPKRIYIAGPMRGYDGHNFPAFFAAEALVRARHPGADVMNPAREDVVRHGLQKLLADDPTGLSAGRALVDGEHPFTNDDLRAALTIDLAYVCSADLVAALPGWRQSKGAMAEVATAEAIGVQVIELVAEDVAWSKPAESSKEPERTVTETYERVFGGELRRSVPGTAEAVSAMRDLLDSEAEEVRVTSETGGEKGSKVQAFDQVSPEVELLVAEHFGKGARKYDAHNFRRGYPWSLSYSALRRHLAAFWAGEEYDEHRPGCPEGCVDHTGSLHIVAVIWHAMVLTEFYLHHKEFDDRYVYPTE